MKPEEQQHRKQELLKRMCNVAPLADEPDFISRDNTLTRFLAAREWKLNEAEKLLRHAVEWRRQYRPLVVDCRWCHERPGYHCMRQVGFDLKGRPVIYSAFSQQATRKNTADDSIAHCTYLIENAWRTMPPGVSSWVWVMDCTGMTLSCCNPKQGYACAQVFANCYPETLGIVIVINHNTVFHSVWKAIKVFIDPKTVAKVRLERSKDKIQSLFKQHFPEELMNWLNKEIELNKRKPLPATQKHFWEKPASPDEHDPRGCDSYIQQNIEPFQLLPSHLRHADGVYKPHPNVIDSIEAGHLTPSDTPMDEAGKAEDELGSLDSDFDDGKDIEIPEEYQIQETVHL